MYTLSVGFICVSCIIFLQVAFAMTINKSQGQSLDIAGLYLPTPCFSHGQLYVSLSRCGNPPTRTSGVKIVVEDTDQQGAIFST